PIQHEGSGSRAAAGERASQASMPGRSEDYRRADAVRQLLPRPRRHERSEDSEWLKPLVKSPRLKLVSGLPNATETHPAPGNKPPPSVLWTERFKPKKNDPVYTLMDQVWLSPALAAKLQAAFIGRRTKMAGDGSDHDPSWVVLDL